MAVSFTLNGKAVQLNVPDDMPLLWAIRDIVGLTGTKFGCGVAQCGACTVHVDGEPVRSCSLPVADAKGKKVTTIEGIASRPAKAVQAAWQKLDVPQCGYCQSGQIMSAAALLEKNARPSDEDIDNAMSGTICRCATYHRIRAAIPAAAKSLAGGFPCCRPC
jgi:isoquinoline 1-oxidoreductase alpha subunit